MRTKPTMYPTLTLLGILLGLGLLCLLSGCGTTREDRVDLYRWVLEEVAPSEPEPTPEPDRPPPPADGERVDTGRGGRYDLPAPSNGVSGTFLWKPHSESTGRVFILTTGKRWLETERVEIGDLGPDGLFRRLERVRWHRNNEPGVNGWRLHWSAARKASDYPSPVWVREYTFDGRIYEYHIPNPSARVEDGSGGHRLK